ncbi:MAG: VacJ family lipoprotein [Deltaproteobacteria bacterium]|nr:VacJ family lipoprotein [Deltaproteobacteria bacterium]
MRIFQKSWLHILFAILFILLSSQNISAFVRENGTLIVEVALNSFPSEAVHIQDNVGDEDFFDNFEDEFGDPSENEPFDPLSGYNRVMTTFNDKFYFWLVKPVAKGYKFVVPEGGRLAVNRFFKNLLFPVRFINNSLQLKARAAGVELSRFCINSTVGILGLWDPAKDWLELEAYPEDFGQTLGHYGVGSGFHVVLPILGPSNLRDSISLIPDYFLEPVSLIEPDLDELAVKSYDKLNYTSLHIGEYESLKKDAVDLYPFLRDAYEQNRKKKVKE